MQVTDNSNNEQWFEEVIANRYIKHYEYQHFSNIQRISSGAFGIVYRANWRNSEQHFVLKSFFNLDNVTAKELVREVILHWIINPFEMFLKNHYIF